MRAGIDNCLCEDGGRGGGNTTGDACAEGTGGANVGVGAGCGRTASGERCSLTACISVAMVRIVGCSGALFGD